MRDSKTTKMVKLEENWIRALCYKSSAIFMSQPMLLELEAPIKICGKFAFKICSIYSGDLYEMLAQFLASVIAGKMYSLLVVN